MNSQSPDYASSQSSDDAPLILQHWIYLGHRWNNNELVDCFIPVSQDEVDLAAVRAAAGFGSDLSADTFHRAPVHFFQAHRKSKGSKAIGGVYGVMATEDATRARTGSATFESQLKNSELIAEWRITSEAADVRDRLLKQEKIGRRLPLDCLDPMRQAYAKARTYDERAAIEVLALFYIRGR